jgi:hypothetical protein
VATEIAVRVVPRPGQEGELAGGQLTERLSERIDELGESIAEIAKRLRGRLEAELAGEPSSDWRLGEVALNFSLDLQAEAGVVVAKAKTAAGFEVTLTWRREQAAE